MVHCMVIETPTIEQSASIAALYRAQGWRQGSDEDSAEWIEKLVRGSHCFVVAVDDREIVGMGRAISDRVSDAYIQDVTVRVNHRRQGIGGRIVRTILERLESDGLRWIGLIAEPGSSSLYLHAGFREMSSAVPMLLIRKS